MEIVQELSDRGYRIWYDGGIEVGNEWPEYIAKHLAGVSLMLAFISNAYMRSDNCRKEMHYALTKRISTINVFLEDTQMTQGMEMQIGNLFVLMKYNMSDSVFYEKLLSAPQLGADLLADDGQVPERRRRVKKHKKTPVDLTVEAKKKKKRKIRRVILLSLLLVLLAACVTLGIIGYSTGLAQRFLISHRQADIEALPADTAVHPENELLMRAARDYTGIADGEIHVADLAGLTELYIYGDQYSFTASVDLASTEIMGEIADLSDLVYFTGLQKLSVANQPLHSL